MALNKRQHFVPQHYLRQFRIEGTKQIGAAKIEPFHFIGPAAISGQCQQDYIYKGDGELDNIFSECEDDLAPVLSRVSKTMQFNQRELIALRLLAVLLHVRTKKSIEHAKLLPRKQGFELIKAAIARGELPPPKGGWEEHMMDFEGMAGNLLKASAIPCWLEMQTLGCKLLRASGSAWFVTSDHPVVTLNPLFSSSEPHRSYVGFSRSGFQLLLPISPLLCLFFYDPKVYKVGSRKQTLVTLSPEDVELINSLQIQSADKCIYFHRLNLEHAIHTLITKYASLRLSIASALQELPRNPGGERVFHFRQPTLRLKRPWKFCVFQHTKRIGPDKRRDPAWTNFVGRIYDDMELHPGRTVFESMERVLGAPLNTGEGRLTNRFLHAAPGPGGTPRW